MNVGGERIARFVALAVGGGVAAGLASAIVHTSRLRLYDLSMDPSVAGLFAWRTTLASLVEWLAIATLFAAFRAFVPASTPASRRAWLWFGAFLPAAIAVAWIASAWGWRLSLGWIAPWEALELRLERERWTSWTLHDLVGRRLLRDALPLVATGLVTSAPVRLQVATCAAAGLLAGGLLAALRSQWAPTSQRAVEVAYGLVPLALLLGALFLERETVAGPGEEASTHA